MLSSGSVERVDECGMRIEQCIEHLRRKASPVAALYRGQCELCQLILVYFGALIRMHTNNCTVGALECAQLLYGNAQ